MKICDFDLASGLKEVRELRNKIGSAGRSATSSGFQSGGQSYENPIGHHDFQPFNLDVGGKEDVLSSGGERFIVLDGTRKMNSMA